MVTTNLLNMTLHLEGRVKLLVAVFALCEVTEVEVLLLLVINVALHMLHDPQVVVQHLVAVPALGSENRNIWIFMRRKIWIGSSRCGFCYSTYFWFQFIQTWLQSSKLILARWHLWHQTTWSTSLRVMACRLIGDKPLPKAMWTYCQLDHMEDI